MKNVLISCGGSESNGCIVKFDDDEKVFIISTAHGIFDWDSSDKIGLKGELDIKTFNNRQVNWKCIYKFEEDSDYFSKDFVLIEIEPLAEITPYTISIPNTLLNIKLRNVAKLGATEYRIVHGTIISEQDSIACTTTYFPYGSSGLGLLNEQGCIVAMVKSTSDSYLGVRLSAGTYKCAELGRYFVNSLQDSRHEAIHGKVITVSDSILFHMLTL